MSETEKVINKLNTAKIMLCNPQILIPEMRVIIGQVITSAIDLLKEQNNCENCAIAIEDRQPVIRCKDCKNADILPWTNNAIIVCKKHNYISAKTDEFYCADGEKV